MKEDYVHVQVFEPSMRAFALLGLRHFGVSHVVQQLSISMFLSILTFDFDLILGLFFTFWGYFWGLGRVHTLFWGLLMYLNNFYSL